MSGGFWVRFAWRSLCRDGQRSALAAGCIAFGVLSLVGLQQLSHIVDGALLLSPRIKEGGDLILEREAGISDADLLELEAQAPEGFAPVARSSAFFLRPVHSGRTTIVSSALGIDPARYPLQGRFEFRGGGKLATLLALDGAAVLTADLADRFGLGRGDCFYLFGAPDAAPFTLTVAAVARVTPDRVGQSVFFSIDTAAARGTGRITKVLVLAADPPSAATRLRAGGWNVREVTDVGDEKASALFRFMLAGAGVLGLLLGGIGVAHTMQVLLARRRQEVAALKAIGYRRVHLLRLFGLEAGMLGFVGSLFGVAFGLGLAWVLMQMLRVNSAFLLDYDIKWSILVSAVVVGVMTTLVFSTVAMMRASEVRPSILLRDILPPPLRRGQRMAGVGLYFGLAALFAAISAAILQSLVRGVLVVASGLVGLGLLGLLLTGVLLLVVRIPVRRMPLLSMAMGRLRHQPTRAVHGLVALSVGVGAVGTATVVLRNADLRFESSRIDLAGINLRVYATTTEETQLRAAIREQRVDAVFVDTGLAAQVYDRADSFRVGIQGVVGRDPDSMRWNLSLVDSTDVEAGRAAYVIKTIAEAEGLVVGDTLSLRTDTGAADVILAGIYERTGSSLNLAAPPSALVVPLALAQSVGPAVMPLQMHVAAPEERLDEVANAIGLASVNAVVIGKDAIADAINRIIRGLFWFAVAVAGLALVAGIVLIANTTGLTMLERRRELGILKALGYQSHQVLLAVVLENAVTGLIAGATAVAALALAIPLINRAAPDADLALHAGQAGLLVLVAVGCATGAAVVVAWRPSRQRPLEILRGE